MNILRHRGWYQRPNSQVEIILVREYRNDWHVLWKGGAWREQSVSEVVRMKVY